MHSTSSSWKKEPHAIKQTVVSKGSAYRWVASMAFLQHLLVRSAGTATTISIPKTSLPKNVPVQVNCSPSISLDFSTSKVGFLSFTGFLLLIEALHHSSIMPCDVASPNKGDYVSIK
jgi:hypothetical protein